MERVGVFTTVRVLRGEACWWGDHVARLVEGARVFGLAMPEAAHLHRDLQRAVGPLPDARARITLRPDLSCAIEADAYEPPAAPWRVRAVRSSPDEDTVRHKTTQRREYERARGLAEGLDDALLLDANGSILECTIANVFFLERGRLVTPPRRLPILAGIARERVFSAASELGIEAGEEALDLDRARSAEACFVTNALMGVQPVDAIEGHCAYETPRLVQRLREVVGPR